MAYKMSKKFTMGIGKYYFNIKSGQQNITIMRGTKEEALRAFLGYKSVGKDCEWVGCWNGKKITETTLPTAEG